MPRKPRPRSPLAPTATTISDPPAAAVAEAILARCSDRLAPQAVALTTSAPERVAFADLDVSPAVRDFVVRYEPRVRESGLYQHQAAVLTALAGDDLPDVVLTTSTSSGKSLAFLAWLVEATQRDTDATALACYPTQALLWGQAERLRAISEPESLVEYDEQTYAGEIVLGDVRIPWTVWHGTTGSPQMKEHEGSQVFASARLRLTTLDKVHWSLMRGAHGDFLAALRAVVVDEAHMWHGLAGANVRATIDRIRLSLDLCESPAPAFFLASATLAEPQRFAAELTGCDADRLLVIDDRGASSLELVEATDVPALLRASAAKGDAPRRFVLLVGAGDEPLGLRDLLGDADVVGPRANAIGFVQSKFMGHRLRSTLARALPARTAIAYDGDMTPRDRRRVERELFQGGGDGLTVVATSALEVGVDLPELDVVVMDELPPRRADLLQRLGRVGRTAARPGLAVLCLGHGPLEARALEAPDVALSAAGVRALPLPLHLEIVRLRAMGAAFTEWMPRLRAREATWSAFNDALDRHFGAAPTYAELKQWIELAVGDDVDLDGGAWFYKGFRVSASQGKRKLVLRGTNDEVAQIDDIAVFRDAHPEGVYLGHDGDRYRVVGYRGSFHIARWDDPESEVVLGKWMKGLSAIEVVREPRAVATRGRWKDRFDLHEAKELRDDVRVPGVGSLDYGVWSFVRRFDGYVELDLTGRSRAREVSLGEVSGRFHDAVAAGESFPFLHAFSYRTLGWRWNVVRVLPDVERRTDLAGALEGLVGAYLRDAAQCAAGDLAVTFEPRAGELRVIDGTPGGNGLAEALLSAGLVEGALQQAAAAAAAYADQPHELFRRYLAEECHVEADLTAEEVADGITSLARAWSR